MSNKGQRSATSESDEFSAENPPESDLSYDATSEDSPPRSARSQTKDQRRSILKTSSKTKSRSRRKSKSRSKTKSKNKSKSKSKRKLKKKHKSKSKAKRKRKHGKEINIKGTKHQKKHIRRGRSIQPGGYHEESTSSDSSKTPLDLNRLVLMNHHKK